MHRGHRFDFLEDRGIFFLVYISRWQVQLTNFQVFFKASADAFYKSKCLSVCLSLCLFTFEVPFNGRFAPISQSRMSNIFRDSESLGKSNGKKWSWIWTFMFENCLKSPRKKSFFFSHFFLLLRYRLTVFLPPLPEVGCLIFLEIQNPWGKVIERNGLTFEHFFWKWSIIAAQKKVFFADFALQNMVETRLPEELETSGWSEYR